MTRTTKQVSMRVDYFDQCDCLWEREKKVYDGKRIEHLMEMCAESGVTEVHWRISVCGKVAYHSKVMQPFDGEYRLQSRGLLEAMARFDPLELATSAAHRYGLTIYPWVDLFDSWYIGLEDPFFRQKPRLLMLDKSQMIPLRGVPCYAEEETQEYRLAEAKELLNNYDIDGLMYSTNTHCWGTQGKERYHTPLFYGYNEPVVREFKNKYGVDILKETFDTLAFRKLHGEFLLQYLKRVQKECRDRNKRLAINISTVSVDPHCIEFTANEPERVLGIMVISLPDVEQQMLLLELKELLHQEVGDTYIIAGDRFIMEVSNSPDLLLEGKKRRGTPPYYQWLVHVLWGKKSRAEILRFRDSISYAGKSNVFDGVSFHEVATFEFDSPELWNLIKEYQGLTRETHTFVP